MSQLFSHLTSEKNKKNLSGSKIRPYKIPKEQKLI